MKFALKAKAVSSSISSDGYYTGQDYTYQGSRYAVVDNDVGKAKLYSTKARAYNASKMVFENYSFAVEEI